MTTMFYSREKRCVFFTNKTADDKFWDKTWSLQGDWIKTVTPKISKSSGAISLILRYVKLGDRILEAGCGMGQYVYCLDKLGYECTGIDFAKETVSKLNTYYPHLDIRFINVFDLSSFPSESYHCYYSGGLVEHFWNGYVGIIKEAERVLKPGGIAIFTFPFLNHHRRTSTYPVYESNNEPDGFYQFALDPDEFVKNASTFGLKLIHKKSRNGLKGFCEVFPKVRWLRSLYNYKGQAFIVRAIRFAVSMILAIRYGHSIELVFVKQKSDKQS